MDRRDHVSSNTSHQIHSLRRICIRRPSRSRAPNRGIHLWWSSRRKRRSSDDLDNNLCFNAINFNSIVREKRCDIRVVQTYNKNKIMLEWSPKIDNTNWQIALGWLGHSRVPLTASPSAVMNSPRVLAPVHDRIKNSSGPITVIDGLIGKETDSYACERGRIGNKEASSRSTIL